MFRDVAVAYRQTLPEQATFDNQDVPYLINWLDYERNSFPDLLRIGCADLLLWETR